MTQFHDKPKRVSHIRTREQGRELAIFNILTAGYSVLNSTGRAVFERCDGSRTVETIADELRSACVDAPPKEVVLQDTLELIEHLRAQNLIEVISA